MTTTTTTLNRRGRAEVPAALETRAANPPVSLAVFNRMPLYLRGLKALREEGELTVSSVALAGRVALNPSVVKKDLSLVIVNEGKPKVGYRVDSLIEDLENFLGYNNTKDAVLVGVGRLGQALMGYRGFEKYGLNIIAGFDTNPEVYGAINGKKVLPLGKLESAARRLAIKIAVLTVPEEAAQGAADTVIRAGVRAIWNFTAAQIRAPENVVVKNEDMAVSLAVLSQQLKLILEREEREEK